MVAHRGGDHLDADDVETVDRDVVECQARLVGRKGRFARAHLIARIDEERVRPRRVEIQVSQQHSRPRPVSEGVRERGQLYRCFRRKMAERRGMVLEMRRDNAESHSLELGGREDRAPGFARTRPRELHEFDVVEPTRREERVAVVPAVASAQHGPVHGVMPQRTTDESRLIHSVRPGPTAIDFLEGEDVGTEAAAVRYQRLMVDDPVAARTVADVERRDSQVQGRDPISRR